MTPAEAALDYCRRGWSVIPLRFTGDTENRKRPLVDTWEPYQAQPPTEEQVRAWWTKWPNANVGLLTGKVSGLVALDLDGPNARALIEQAGIFLPKTASVKTGKGFHALYKHPGVNTPNGVRLLKDGNGSAVDVRGDGGYVVAPPSVHGTGHVYTWLVSPDEAIEPLPAGVLRLLNGERSGQVSRNEPGWVAQALAGVPEGQRDETCAKLAGYLVGKGLDPDATEALLVHSFARNCEPPFPEGEVRKTVRSITRRHREEGEAAGVPAPDVSRDGDDFAFTWPTLGVEVRATRLRDSGEGVYGEINVSLDGRPLHWGRANLASLSARDGLVTKLNRIRPKIPWREILEEVCRETACQLRAGAPTVQLVPAGAGVERRLVDKVLLDGETNVLFADGGAGKSLFALAIAVAVATGKPLPAGLTPRRSGPVLYLDWESIEAEHQERLGGILAGLGVPGPVPIFYRRMVGALADEAPTLRAEVARVGAVLVIADSLGPACGAEPEGADAAIRALNAVRSIAPARLVLAHVSKLHADQRGATRPFGSVYVMNLPRNVWEIRKGGEDEGDTLTLGAYHRKTNRGRLLQPFGLRFEFGENGTRLQAADLGQDAGLRARAGPGFSILAALRPGAKTIGELAEELEASPDAVQKALYRQEKAGKVVRVGEPGHGPGRPVKWGLKA